MRCWPLGFPAVAVPTITPHHRFMRSKLSNSWQTLCGLAEICTERRTVRGPGRVTSRLQGLVPANFDPAQFDYDVHSICLYHSAVCADSVQRAKKHGGTFA